MNTRPFFVSAVTAALLFCGANSRAATSLILNGDVAGQRQFQTVRFGERKEAEMLRRAYHILETGDHDYKGRRVAAMTAIEDAAKILDFDLHGDKKDHEKQVLSDERLREAKELLVKVREVAEVKDEKRVYEHINHAIKEISDALEAK